MLHVVEVVLVLLDLLLLGLFLGNTLQVVQLVRCRLALGGWQAVAVLVQS